MRSFINTLPFHEIIRSPIGLQEEIPIKPNKSLSFACLKYELPNIQFCLLIMAVLIGAGPWRGICSVVLL